MYEHSIQVLNQHYMEACENRVYSMKKRDMADFIKWKSIIKEYEAALAKLDPTFAEIDPDIETDSEKCNHYAQTILVLKDYLSKASSILANKIIKNNKEEIKERESIIKDFESAIVKLTEK